ncbi:unnamed protein product [Spirodela intermedia]|uniref:Uncharacterized protein n=1 Tax=Spirodela intermedia TaxID=51605 RepID=A0A7I8J5Y1_SPIIN|nr:unnamed protein product [Spirodela intermedia]CAA6665175.1 unnamed protein product [Spirodela intermedia]
MQSPARTGDSYRQIDSFRERKGGGDGSRVSQVGRRPSGAGSLARRSPAGDGRRRGSRRPERRQERGQRRGGTRRRRPERGEREGGGGGGEVHGP